MLIVNFKTYADATGEKAIGIASQIRDAASGSNTTVAISPQAVDARDIIQEVRIEVWAQHVDVYSEGRSTGWFPPETAKAEGFTGTLLNHSEHKLAQHVLEETVKMCKNVGLKVLIFAASFEEAVEVAAYSPDYVCYEPPELVGSKETSVAESRPETIRKVVEQLPNVPVLVGAGVKSADDIKVSLQMGAKGVLVSSAIVLSEDPKSKVEELLAGFSN